jgi:WbqC-like protein family
MRLAVMQPYLFPYLGYFQLLHSVDRFVLFDDVNFIKRGWINRNRILLDGGEYRFTVPLEGASQNRPINQTLTINGCKWKSDLLKTLERAYRRAPHFGSAFPVIEASVSYDERNIAQFVAHSLALVVRHIGIDAELVPTSSGYRNNHLRGQDRIIDICVKEGANVYHNAQGGRELYDGLVFASAGIDLRFIASRFRNYPQKSETFVPGLSIIDVLMWNELSDVQAMVRDYEVGKLQSADRQTIGLLRGEVNGQ